MSIHTGEQLTGGIGSAAEKRVSPSLALQTMSAEHPSWMEYTIGVYREIFTLKDLDCTFGLLLSLWMAIGLYKWIEAKGSISEQIVFDNTIPMNNPNKINCFVKQLK
jgi:hypothetical protein